MAKKIIICKDCGEEKPLQGHGLCKPCYMRKYYQDNKERISKCERKYHKRNKDKVREYHQEYYKDNRVKFLDRSRKRRLDKYGITLTEYDELLEEQGDHCIFCGKTPAENGSRLCVDHDHETGEVRGLLCGNCNRALGLFQDSSEICRQDMLYLKHYGR